MKYFHRTILLILLINIAACASVPLEGVYAPINAQGWKVAYANDIPGKGNIVERIPSEETLQNWSKMVTIQFMEGESRSATAFMEQLRKQMQQKCSSVNWSVIESDSSSILYEWSIYNCSGQDNQHEISRLLRGNDGLHRMAYVQKVPKISPSVRNTWVQNLNSAYLVKGDSNSPIVLKSNNALK